MGTNGNGNGLATSSNVLTDMLGRRRDRAISIILGMKERDCDSYLPRDVSLRLRKVILDQINEVVDFAMDVCNSLDTGDVVLNEEYLRKLDDIHAVIVEEANLVS